MLFCLSSNCSSVAHIREYTESFALCLLHTRYEYPFHPPKRTFVFDVYYQDGMDMEPEENENNMEFRYHSCSTITDALDQIAELLINISQVEQNKDEDIREEIMISVCGTYKTNKEICNYLNECFVNHDDTDLQAVDLYQYYKIGSSVAMTNTFKKILHTEFIYPDDPISFSYAMYQVMTS